MSQAYQTKKRKNSPTTPRQQGSVRKLTRANGTKVWEWRYRVAGTMRQETFSVTDYPTRNELSHHLKNRIELLDGAAGLPTQQRGVPMAKVIERYNDRELKKLAKSTRDTISSMLRVHFEPRWNDTVVENVFADDVEEWLETLADANGNILSGASRTRARNRMKVLLDRAMVWRYLPVGVNPITLVRVEGATKRVKPRFTITIDQVNLLIAALPQPIHLMVLIAASLGLRVEEIIPLKWTDFDFDSRTIVISRAYTHGELKETNTDASNASLPIEGALVDALLGYRETRDKDVDTPGWLFPSPATGGCMSPDVILTKKIKPGLAILKLPNIGWHSIRHSYKNWQKAGGFKIEYMKDLMRHSDIATTMNSYGDSRVEELRPMVAAVGNLLKYTATTS